MRICIGSDHGGFELKKQLIEYLVSGGHDVHDMGAQVMDSTDDYPDFAIPVAEAVAKDPASRGIVICRSGVGVCIAANKVKGIRSYLALSEEILGSACAHDHINVLALSGDHTAVDDAIRYVDMFLSTPVDRDARHERRLRKIDEYEDAHR